jgi:esterase/lipase superfamily enzyme
MCQFRQFTKQATLNGRAIHRTLTVILLSRVGSGLPILTRLQLPQRKKRGVSVDTLIFVHGFNVNNAEAVYRLAQIKHDYQVDGEAVLFSWPSAGSPAGYVYDRDSVTFSRDGLEQVINALTAKSDQTVFLVGHSMGSHLVMEVLRQMSLSGNRNALSRISGVALTSTDIDPDVFRRQITRIDPLPERFAIFTSEQDRALGVTSFLTGNKSRLGVITRPQDVADLPVTLIDLTSVRDGDTQHHNVAATSPTAMAFLRGLLQQGSLQPHTNARLIRAPRRISDLVQ